MKHFSQKLLWLATCCSTLLLGACDVGLSAPSAFLGKDAPQIFISATNIKSTGADPVLPVSNPAASNSVQSFRTKDGRRVDLQAGYLNLLPIELVTSCDALALMRRSLWPIASASAHGGSGGGSTGTASGSSSGAINVAKPDQSKFDMGRLAAEPGTYCGLRMTFVPIGDDEAVAPKSGHSRDVSPRHGGDLSADESAYFHVYPCSYAASPLPEVPGLPIQLQPNAQQEEACVNAAPTKTAIAPVLLKFAQPLVLATGRSAALVIQMHYDRWFDDVDIPKLPTDAVEQAKLVQNMRQSFQAVITQ